MRRRVTGNARVPDETETVAGDLVASTTFIYETLQAVCDCILWVGAWDGDGGALGKVQAYIGMTEEQSRLTLHARRLVWVYGYNSREQLRDDLGTSLQNHVDLARYGVSLSLRPPPNSASSTLMRCFFRSKIHWASKCTCMLPPYLVSFVLASL